jgi:hypothetical protein
MPPRVRSCVVTLRCCVYAHLFTGLVLALKFDYSVDLGKESIIASLAHIHARMDPGPALANDDRSRVYQLAIVPFHAEVLWIAVSTISGTADAFFMSHFLSSESFHHEDAEESRASDFVSSFFSDKLVFYAMISFTLIAV